MQLNKVLKYIIFGGLFVMPFILFSVPDGMFFPFISGKGLWFRLIVEIIFACFAILALRDERYRLKFSWIIGAMAIFTGLIFISDLLSPNVTKSFWSNYERMEGWILLAHLFAYLIVLVSVLKDQKFWYRLLNTYVGASVIMSVYGLFQLGGSVPFHMGQGRVDGTLGNPAYMAVYLLIHIFLALYLLYRAKGKKWLQVTYGAIITLHFIILFYTGTRGALGGLVIGLLVGLFIFTLLEKELPKARKISAGVLIAIVILTGIFYSIRKSDFVVNSGSLGRFATVFNIKEAFFSRSNIWEMALEGFKKKPILGWGQESFNHVFNQNYKPEMWGQEQWFDRAHNVFFDWMVAGGILGILSYLSLFFFAFWYIWKRSRFDLAEKSIFTALLVAYFIHNIFVFDHLASYMLFILILGLIHFEHQAYHLEKGTHKHKNKEKSHTGQNKAGDSDDEYSAYAIPAIGFILIASVYFVIFRPYKANTLLIKALAMNVPQDKLDYFKKSVSLNTGYGQEIREQIIFTGIQAIQQIPESSIKEDWKKFSAETVENHVKSAPKDARANLFAGQFMAMNSNYEKAKEYLESAHDLSPQKQTIIIPLAQLYMGGGEDWKAYEILKYAYDLDPTFLGVHDNLGIATVRVGKIEEGLSILRESLLKEQTNVMAWQAFAFVDKLDQLVKFYEAEKKTDPKNMSISVSLVNLYSNLEQKQKMLNELNYMKKTWPESAPKVEEFLKNLK